MSSSSVSKDIIVLVDQGEIKIYWAIQLKNLYAVQSISNSPASSILLPSGSRLSSTDSRFHRLWELCRETQFVQYSPTMLLSHKQHTTICPLTCAHMRIMSVFVLSQSIKTFTTWINPWLVRISSFSKRVFSLCTDWVLCWLSSESEPMSKGGDTMTNKKDKLISTFESFGNQFKKRTWWGLILCFK